MRVGKRVVLNGLLGVYGFLVFIIVILRGCEFDKRLFLSFILLSGFRKWWVRFRVIFIEFFKVLRAWGWEEEEN